MRSAHDGFDRQPTLESELLLVRPLVAGDHDALFTVSSDPLLWEQHPAKERATPEGFAAWMDSALASGGALVVIDKESDVVIGTSRYDGYDTETNSVEIGWTFLARSHWGGTYNGELKRLMLAHAFATVDAVRLRAHEANMRSRTAIEKLGAVFVGAEPDRSGRGVSHHYRLERESVRA